MAGSGTSTGYSESGCFDEHGWCFDKHPPRVFGIDGLFAELGQDLTLGDRLFIFHQDAIVSGQRVFVGKDLAVDDSEHTHPILLVQLDPAVDVRDDGFTLGDACLKQLLDTGQTVGDVRRPSHTTGVEGPQRELGAGLADRLGGDDTHGLAYLDIAPAGQVAAVAGGAHAVAQGAGQRRADVYLVDLQFFDDLCLLLVDHFACGDNDLAGLWVDHRG